LGAIKAQPKDTCFSQLTEASFAPYKLSGNRFGTLREFWRFLAWGVIDLWQDYG
jgi:hypothetical protein